MLIPRISRLTLENLTVASADSANLRGGAGGAVYSGGTLDVRAAKLDVLGNLALSGRGSARGGALCAIGGMTISGDASELTAQFASNKAIGAHASSGGAIYSEGALDVWAENFDAEGNAALAGGVSGGAIFAQDKHVGGDVTIAGGPSLSVMIASNKAVSTGSGYLPWARGGAVYAYGSVDVTAGSVVMSGNAAESAHERAHGGAIYSVGDASVMALMGDAVFSGNRAVSSGAVDASGGLGVTPYAGLRWQRYDRSAYAVKDSGGKGYFYNEGSAVTGRASEHGAAGRSRRRRGRVGPQEQFRSGAERNRPVLPKPQGIRRKPRAQMGDVAPLKIMEHKCSQR